MIVFEMRKLLKFLLLLLSIIVVNACCKTNNETTITFIGDSLISRWDLDVFFPTHEICNIGLAGSGIKWIEQYNEKLINQTVVVLTGTNDLSDLADLTLDAYACQYVETIMGLKAKRLILISILPRNNEKDNKNINQLISVLNRMIADGLKKEKTVIYCNVYPDFLKNGTLNMNLSYDGIHLNSYGYEILAKKIKSLL